MNINISRLKSKRSREKTYKDQTEKFIRGLLSKHFLYTKNLSVDHILEYKHNISIIEIQEYNKEKRIIYFKLYYIKYGSDSDDKDHIKFCSIKYENSPISLTELIQEISDDTFINIIKHIFQEDSLIRINNECKNCDGDGY